MTDFEINYNVQVFDFPCPDTPSKCEPLGVTFQTGKYMFELWGASGADSALSGKSNTGGRGGYSKGILFLRRKTKLYFYIGGKGEWVLEKGSLGGWNGGGNSTRCGGSGGGATDVRYSMSDEITSNLETRIIVAGGGGGSYQGGSCHSSGGDGGGKTGKSTELLLDCPDDTLHYACYGTQSDCVGGKINNKGAMGVGGSGMDQFYAGGGGGYWGGGAARKASGGGSGYIGGASIYHIIYGYMETGVNSGNGKIQVTLLSLTCTTKFSLCAKIFIIIFLFSS